MKPRQILALFVVLGALLVPLVASADDNFCGCFVANMRVSDPSTLPGQLLRFRFEEMPTQVDTLTLSLVLPAQIRFVSKGSAPFKMVDGVPILTQHNLNSAKVLYFNARVSRTAPRNKRFWVVLNTVAVPKDGGPTQTLPFKLPIHTRK